MVDAHDGVGLARAGLGPVQVAGQRGVQDVVNQRRFARSTRPGHHRHGAQWNVDTHVLEVVFPRPAHAQLLAVAAPPRAGHLDLQLAAQVLAGQAVGVVLHLFGRALRHQLPAVDARARPHVHQMVGLHHGVLVVLDHQQRVAQVAQVLQGADQAVVVLGVQADAGFVQHVQHAGQAAAHLGRQPDALRLAARQGVGRPVQ